MGSTTPSSGGDFFHLAATPAERCVYLEDRDSVVSAYCLLSDDPSRYDDILAQGYRRSGVLHYKPTCSGCCQCIPIRIPLEDFRPSRSQRRLLGKYGNVYDVQAVPLEFRQEHFDLYSRHAKFVSSSAPSTDEGQYIDFLVDSAVETRLLEYRIRGTLVGVSFLDFGNEAASSAYFCWDPTYRRCSPGTFSALWEILACKEQPLRYYYLGYWVEECGSMSYKNRFRPFELMDWSNNRWSVHGGGALL